MGGPEPDIDPTAGPPSPPGSYDVAGIEITQVVQDLAHTVPLVAGKTTVARVYLDRPESDIVTVRGELEVISALGGTLVVPSMDRLDLDPAANGQTTAKRLRLDGSLNFLIPATLTVAGGCDFRLHAVRLEASGVALAPITSPTVSVSFLDTPPLRLRLVSFSYVAGTSSQVHEPSATDHALIESWLRRAFPVADVQLSRLTVAVPSLWPFTTSGIHTHLTAMRNTDLTAGGDPLAHYYGLVTDSGGFVMGGQASIMPGQPDPSAVACGPTGVARFSWDTDGSYGDWYTGHELAHTFGRLHLESGCGDQPKDPAYPHPNGQISGSDDRFVGFDVGDPSLGLSMRVYPGTQYHDVMSYCPFIWLSGFTYTAIRDRLEAESVSNLGPGLGPFVISDPLAPDVKPGMTKWVNVVGTLDFSRRTGTIDVMQPFMARETLPGREDRAELRTYDAEGRLLGVFPARVKVDQCRTTDEETGILDSFVPAPTSIARVELAVGGVPVAARTSRAAARVAGEYQPQFTVQVSTDDGETWQTVAVGAQSPDYGFRRSDFAGARSIRIRVTETDGFESRLVRDDVFADAASELLRLSFDDGAAAG